MAELQNQSNPHSRAMEVSSEPTAAPTEQPAPVLVDWKEACGAVTLSQGAEAVRNSHLSKPSFPTTP